MELCRLNPVLTMRQLDARHFRCSAVECSIRNGFDRQALTGKVYMADQLKSFRKDWQRWSAAEKLTAVSLLVTLAALLGAPLAAILG